MTYRVELTRRAERDLGIILDWLQSRSRTGAASWLAKWKEVLRELAIDPIRFSLAPENEDHADVEIWHVVFKTRRGKKYRAIYVIRGNIVFITHIRGPGQDMVPPELI